MGNAAKRTGLTRARPRRKDIRLREYDYSSDGYYFVTICTFHKEPKLQRHEGILRRTLLSLPERFDGLGIDYNVLMPTHLHVIFTFDGVRASLGEVVRTFKALVTTHCREAGEHSPFWQRNYYEHVIRDPRALSKIRTCIDNHPSAGPIDFKQFYR